MSGYVPLPVAAPNPIVSPFAKDTGSAAIESLADQAVAWGLVVAVAMVLICAATWAIGSAASHPQTAARAKTGVIVALVGALILGAGQGYLSWLDSGQVDAFAADPASYRVETVAPGPGVETASVHTSIYEKPTSGGDDGDSDGSPAAAARGALKSTHSIGTRRAPPAKMPWRDEMCECISARP